DVSGSMCVLVHLDVELGVLTRELDDHTVAAKVRGLEVDKVDVHIARVILTVAVLSQCACQHRLVGDLAAIESPPFDINGLVEVVVEPGFEVMPCHPGHKLRRRVPPMRPQYEVAHANTSGSVDSGSCSTSDRP